MVLWGAAALVLGLPAGIQTPAVVRPKMAVPQRPTQQVLPDCGGRASALVTEALDVQQLDARRRFAAANPQYTHPAAPRQPPIRHARPDEPDGLTVSRPHGPHASSASRHADMPTSWHPCFPRLASGLAVVSRTAQAAALQPPDSPNRPTRLRAAAGCPFGIAPPRACVPPDAPPVWPLETRWTAQHAGLETLCPANRATRCAMWAADAPPVLGLPIRQPGFAWAPSRHRASCWLAGIAPGQPPPVPAAGLVGGS